MAWTVPGRGGDETAAVLGQGAGTDQHVAGIGPGDDQVVRIVRDRRAQGAVVRQPEAADQPQADPARGPVPLDAGDQEDVALRVERPVAVDPADAPRRAPGDDLVGDDLDHRTSLRRERQAERRFVERGQVDRVLAVEPGRGTVVKALPVARRDLARP